MLVMLVCVLSLKALAFKDLTVSPTTAAFWQEITVTGSYGTAATSADIEIFLDRNANGVFDEGVDLPTVSSAREGFQITDGGSDGDPDQTQDGLFTVTTMPGLDRVAPVAGTYVISMSNSAGADTASWTVSAISPTTTIAGTVGGLDNPAELCVIATVNDTPYYALTQANGQYAIPLPDGTRGQPVSVQVRDQYDVLEGAGWPPAPIDTTVAASLSGIDFVFAAPTQFIRAVIVKLTGDTLKDIQLSSRNYAADFHDIQACDSKGVYLFPVFAGSWEFGLESSAFLAENPKVTITEADDTVDVLIHAVKPDTVINGQLIDSTAEGVDLSNFYAEVRLRIDSTWYSAFTSIDAQGAYTVQVVKAYGPYEVQVYAKDTAGIFIQRPAFYELPAGHDTLVSWVFDTQGSLSGTVTGPNDLPLTWHMITVTNLLTGMVGGAFTDGEGKFSIGLRNGTYRLSVQVHTGDSTSAELRKDSVVVKDNNVTVNLSVADLYEPTATRPGVAAARRQTDFHVVSAASATRLLFTTANAGRARLSIYTLDGRLIATPFDGVVAGGANYAINWRNATGYLTPMTYVAQLRLQSAGGAKEVRQLRFAALR
jgi:hypothetical protein